MSALAAGQPTPLALARRFALTLIPIAVGYHVAHYLVYLLIQGQYIIPLLSDPFGYGWDLFGTAGYRVDIGLVGARSFPTPRATPLSPWGRTSSHGSG